MIVTFMIGNGFDLNCGLKSSFKDVCNEYCSTNSKSEVIKMFKKDIATWGDFEMAMAKHINAYKNEEDFLECVHDFVRFLNKYLKNEEKKYIEAMKKDNYQILSDLNDECTLSLNSFYTYGTQNTVRLINELTASINKFNFISFNYTDFLDRRIIENANAIASRLNRNMSLPFEIYLTKEVLHIHGTLNSNLVMGVNDINQFEKAPFEIGKKTLRAFVKPAFNASYDNNRVSSALYAINESDVICVFGMSLGDSDKMWRKSLKEWISASSQHHLFIFDYNCSQKKGLLFDESMNEEDAAREMYCDKLNIDIACENQIHIPIGYNIFNFKRIFDRAIKTEKPDLHELLNKKKEELSAV